MSDTTDFADPISLPTVNNDDAGTSDHTISFLCAGIFLIVVLPCAWYARRVERNRPIPNESIGLTGSKDVLSTKLLPPVVLHYVSGLRYERFAGNRDDEQKVTKQDQLLKANNFELRLDPGYEPALVCPLQSAELVTADRNSSDRTAMTSVHTDTHVSWTGSSSSSSSRRSSSSSGLACKLDGGDGRSGAHESEATCIVCMDRPADAVLLECGHSGLCVECATVLWDQARRCPLCRRGFAAVMRIVARETSSARVEPVHYLLCEAGPDSGTAERVRDITAACPQPPIASAILAFAAGTGAVFAGSAAGSAAALRPAPAAAAL